MGGSGDATSATVTLPSAHSIETQRMVSTPTLLLLSMKEKQIVRVAPAAASWMAGGRRRQWMTAGWYLKPKAVSEGHLAPRHCLALGGTVVVVVVVKFVWFLCLH